MVGGDSVLKQIDAVISYSGYHEKPSNDQEMNKLDEEVRKYEGQICEHYKVKVLHLIRKMQRYECMIQEAIIGGST